MAIPGLGPFIAAGPIMAALAGAGVGGGRGGITGALVGMGIPEYEAKRYEGRIKDGGILLSVHCDDSSWVKLGEKDPGTYRREQLRSAGEASADFAKSDRPAPRRAQRAASSVTSYSGVENYGNSTRTIDTTVLKDVMRHRMCK